MVNNYGVDHDETHSGDVDRDKPERKGSPFRKKQKCFVYPGQVEVIIVYYLSIRKRCPKRMISHTIG